MSKKAGYIAKNVKETAKIAEIFIDEILKNRGKKSEALVVGLSGDLGAGKTAFVKTIARHLGIKNKIISPTFVIMKKYPLKKRSKHGPAHKLLFHLDAYRLKNEKELLYLGWEEIIGNKDHLIFIEWPENVKGVMPKSSKHIHISNPKGEERHFKIR